jgi:hypothetical protein
VSDAVVHSVRRYDTAGRDVHGNNQRAILEDRGGRPEPVNICGEEFLYWYQGVHVSKPFNRSRHQLFRGRRIGDVAWDCEHPGSCEVLIEREFATTA